MICHLEYFYDNYENLDLSQFFYVLSIDQVDEYLFYQLLSKEKVSPNIYLLVTKEVGHLYKVHFNAKMNYKKYRGEKNG